MLAQGDLQVLPWEALEISTDWEVVGTDSQELLLSHWDHWAPLPTCQVLLTHPHVAVPRAGGRKGKVWSPMVCTHPPAGAAQTPSPGSTACQYSREISVGTSVRCPFMSEMVSERRRSHLPRPPRWRSRKLRHRAQCRPAASIIYRYHG